MLCRALVVLHARVRSCSWISHAEAAHAQVPRTRPVSAARAAVPTRLLPCRAVRSCRHSPAQLLSLNNGIAGSVAVVERLRDVVCRRRRRRNEVRRRRLRSSARLSVVRRRDSEVARARWQVYVPRCRRHFRPSGLRRRSRVNRRDFIGTQMLPMLLKW